MVRGTASWYGLHTNERTTRSTAARCTCDGWPSPLCSSALGNINDMALSGYTGYAGVLQTCWSSRAETLVPSLASLCLIAGKHLSSTASSSTAMKPDAREHTKLHRPTHLYGYNHTRTQDNNKNNDTINGTPQMPSRQLDIFVTSKFRRRTVVYRIRTHPRFDSPKSRTPRSERVRADRYGRMSRQQEVSLRKWNMENEKAEQMF